MLYVQQKLKNSPFLSVQNVYLIISLQTSSQFFGLIRIQFSLYATLLLLLNMDIKKHLNVFRLDVLLQ